MRNYLTKIPFYFAATAYAATLSVEKASAADLTKTLKDLLPAGDPTGYSLDSVAQMITSVTNYALDIAGVIAFIMILYASIMYLTSYGEESKAEIAKKTLTWSIIGILAVVFAKSIILIVYNILK